jgi:hypothetical protein
MTKDIKAHLKFYQNSYNYRQRKLQETLLAVQQLDTSMANLRKWLAGIEHDLSTPVIYQECSLKTTIIGDHQKY